MGVCIPMQSNIWAWIFITIGCRWELNYISETNQTKYKLTNQLSTNCSKCQFKVSWKLPGYKGSLHDGKVGVQDNGKQFQISIHCACVRTHNRALACNLPLKQTPVSGDVKLMLKVSCDAGHHKCQHIHKVAHTFSRHGFCASLWYGNTRELT